MTIPMYEIGWIAGFLEGEGYFTLVGRTNKTPRIEASQVDISPLDRLHTWFGGKMWQENRGGDIGRFRGNRQPCWRWFIHGSIAIQVMMTIYPLVGSKRMIEIENILEVWKEAATPLPERLFCKKCGLNLSEENIEWRRRTDGKGRRKWCKNCGQYI